MHCEIFHLCFFLLSQGFSIKTFKREHQYHQTTLSHFLFMLYFLQQYSEFCDLCFSFLKNFSFWTLNMKKRTRCQKLFFYDFFSLQIFVQFMVWIFELVAQIQSWSLKFGEVNTFLLDRSSFCSTFSNDDV